MMADKFGKIHINYNQLKNKTMKAFKSILMALAVVGVTLGFASCSNADEAAKVAEKIQKGEVLSAPDYTVMIDYLGKFAKEAQPVQDQINNLPYGDAKAAGYAEQLSALKDKCKYFEMFSSALGKSTPAEVGTENVAAVDALTGYEWFNAPAWASGNADPGVGGIELDAPASDTTGVVAGAVDRLEVKDR